MSELLEVRVPDIGNFDSVDVIEVLVTVGARVEVDSPLITLESDKASMDVPSPVAGVVREVLMAAGGKARAGDLVAKIETAKTEAAAAVVTTPAPSAPAPEPPAAPPAPPPAAPAPVVAPPAPAAAAAPTVDEAAFAAAYASPAVRAYARELGVDLGRVTGTGRAGRIVKEDVAGFVKTALATGPAPAAGPGFALAAAPAVDFAAFGPIETRALTKIQRLTGQNTHRSWVTIPHVTQFDEADITELEAFRKAESEARGVKLTFLPFLIKAAVAALREYPQFNASLSADGENLVFKKYFHLGVAVDTPQGLVVPVLKNADQKGLLELAAELADLAGRARERKLKLDEMQGGSFTISSLGGVGGTAFTPIVNGPEVAILGVSRGSQKPVWNGSQFVPRLMLPLSLSYDHRVIDGVAGARFTTFLAHVLGDVRRLLL